MSLRRLKWITILGPVVFLTGIEAFRHVVEPDLLNSLPGYVLIGGVVLFGALLFSETIFRVIGRMQTRLAQQNQELLALHQAGLGIAGELQLEDVLQKVVDQACELIGARYGALSVPRPDSTIEAFITSGITPEERERIGPPPTGHGLLSVVLSEGQVLRMADLTSDPRSVGFPEHHPVMHSLLAVPITSREAVIGNLYLAEKEGAAEFSEDDEATLVRFATQAALAIENARLHHQVRELAITEERDRIAREMHDSLAQVLGYVNTKAQAIQELLRAGQVERASGQVGQLSEAARGAYADVREGILGLRTTLGPDRSFLTALREYAQLWQDQSDVAVELRVTPPETQLHSLSPTAELQLLRLIQEALANVRKHARASHVCIHLTESPDHVEAIVEDDGRGFDPGRLGAAGHPRFGLSTMRERAEAVGGDLHVISNPGQGTRVVVHIPTGGVPLHSQDGHARIDR